jgi:hypothetical protein
MPSRSVSLSGPLSKTHERELPNEFAVAGQSEIELAHNLLGHRIVPAIPPQIRPQARRHAFVRPT